MALIILVCGNVKLWMYCINKSDMNLEEKLEKIVDKQWKRLNLHACGSIRWFFDKELKYPYMKETSAKELWKKLEEKYMTKRVENRLFMKKRLF